MQNSARTKPTDMVAEHGCGDPQERIPERIDEQIVDFSLMTEMSLEAVLASKAASKNSWAQVTTDPKVSVVTLAEEPIVLARVTRVLQLETGGAEGQQYSLFRQSSSIGSETPTHPAGSEVMTTVRRLAEKEHSAALDRLTSSISAIMKLGARTDESPFTKGEEFDLGLVRQVAGGSPV